MSMLARTVALLLAVSGCDMIHQQNAPPRVEEARRDVSGDRGGLLACYDDCRAQQLDEADGLTCRKNCEAAFKVAPTAANQTFDAAAACMHRCGESRRCVKACGRAARRAEPTVGDESLRRLAACVDGCQADRQLDAGDRWTCVRNCAQTARGEAQPAPEAGGQTRSQAPRGGR